MKITYSIWQGSNLLSVNNSATSLKEIDKLIADLNTSDTAKNLKYVASVRELKAN